MTVIGTWINMEKNSTLVRAERVIERINFNFFSTQFFFKIEEDKKYGERVYIQVSFLEICKKTDGLCEWFGRKWYLSEHMTDDEIVKTCYAACKAAVEHEMMESFTVDNITLFNPHVNFEELLKISDKEIRRQ